MHFRIDTQRLKDAIDIVNRASVSVSVTPILENILIQAHYKKVTLTANNLELAIEYTIDQGVDIEVEGSFTVSSKFFSSYIGLVQDERIEIRLVAGGSLQFKTASSDTKIKGVDASNFPLLPTVKAEKPITVDAETLKTAFDHTLFSASQGSVRPTLAGVYLRLSEGTMTFASTDSFRLSELVVATASVIPKETTIIIPSKAASQLGYIVGDEKQVELYIHEKELLVISGNVRIFSRLLNGHFPDYHNFFPKGHATKGVIRRQDLIIALKRINLISKENRYNTRFAFDAESGLEITTGDTEIGTGMVKVGASIEGENAMIGLNSTYLLEVLSVMKADYISIDFETPLSPVLIREVPENAHAFTYRHIIMPLKI